MIYTAHLRSSFGFELYSKSALLPCPHSLNAFPYLISSISQYTPARAVPYFPHFLPPPVCCIEIERLLQTLAGRITQYFYFIYKDYIFILFLYLYLLTKLAWNWNGYGGVS